ncbi:MAG: MG2 domain-containing protein, partial [Pseudomonadota bacterium]
MISVSCKLLGWVVATFVGRQPRRNAWLKSAVLIALVGVFGPAGFAPAPIVLGPMVPAALAQGSGAAAGENGPMAQIEQRAQTYAKRLAASSAESPVATLLAQAKRAAATGDSARAIALLEEGVSAGGGYPVWLRLAQARAKANARDPLTAAAAQQAVTLATDPAQRLDAYLVLADAVRASSTQVASGIEDVSNKVVSLTYQLSERRNEAGDDLEKLAEITASPDYRNLEDVRRQWEQTRLDLAQEFTASTATVRAVYDTLFDLLEVNAEARAAFLNERLPSPRVEFRLGALDDANGGDPRAPSWQAVGRFATACLQFTLPLVADAARYRPFITVYAASTAGGAASASSAAELDADDYDVSIDDRRLCLTGLRFGTAYKVLLKPGLPSRSGFSFAGDALEIRAPDRQPQVAFRSSTYLLPTFGARRVPMWTTNVGAVDLHLRRLSDRALHREVALGAIGGTGRRGYDSNVPLEPIWDGRLTVDGPQNQRTQTQLPIGALLGERARWIAARPASRSALRGADGRSELGRVAGTFTAGSFIADPAASGSNLTGAWEPGVYALIGRPHTPPEPGAYVPDAEAREAELAGAPAQWFVVTDLGLAYYRSPRELHVAARSLRTGGAVVGARIELIAKNNRVLGAVETDAAGVARFDARLAAGLGGNGLAAVLAYCDAQSPCQRYGDVRVGPTPRAGGADDGSSAARSATQAEARSAAQAAERARRLARMPDDFSFVDFKRDSFDLSEHGVAGRLPPQFFDAYVTTERGIYRPGETMQATVLVRDAEGETITPLPEISFRLRAVDGRVISLASAVAPTNFLDGGAQVPLVLPTTVRTGVADLEVVVGRGVGATGGASSGQAGATPGGRVIGKTQVRIDYFRPERVRLAFTDPATWERTLSSDGTVSLGGSATAQFLYGKRAVATDESNSDGASSAAGSDTAALDAPAADLVGKLEVRLQAATSPVAQCYDRFAFGLADETFLTRLIRREAGRTGADGALAFNLEVPGVPAGSIPLQA